MQELHDYDKRAEDGQLHIDEMEHIDELCEVYLKLHEIAKISGEHCNVCMIPHAEHSQAHVHNPTEY